MDVVTSFKALGFLEAVETCEGDRSILAPHTSTRICLESLGRTGHQLVPAQYRRHCGLASHRGSPHVSLSTVKFHYILSVIR